MYVLYNISDYFWMIDFLLWSQSLSYHHKYSTQQLYLILIFKKKNFITKNNWCKQKKVTFKFCDKQRKKPDTLKLLCKLTSSHLSNTAPFCNTSGTGICHWNSVTLAIERCFYLDIIWKVPKTVDLDSCYKWWNYYWQSVHGQGCSPS